MRCYLSDSLIIFLLIVGGIIALLIALSPAILASMFFLDVTKSLDSIDKGIKKRNRNIQRQNEDLEELISLEEERRNNIYIDNRSIHLHNNRLNKK